MGRSIYRNCGPGCWDDDEEWTGGCDHDHTTVAAAALCARKADGDMRELTFGIVTTCGWKLAAFDSKKQRKPTTKEHSRYTQERTVGDEEMGR